LYRQIPACFEAGDDSAKDNPYLYPKLLWVAAIFGVLINWAITAFVRSWIPWQSIQDGILLLVWLRLLVRQLLGWHHYFVRLRPRRKSPAQLRKQLEEAQARAAEARLRHEEVLASNAIASAERKAALDAYQQAYQEGREALAALRARAKGRPDLLRHIRAMQDFGRAQTAAKDEPDLAKRMTLQAEAMRRETRHIRNISLSF